MQVLWCTARAMSLKELQGPAPGVESVSDGRRKPREEAGVLEAVNLREIRGSSIANDSQDEGVRQPVHREHVLIEQTETWCDFIRPARWPEIKETGTDETLGFCLLFGKPCCLEEPHVTSAMPGGS
jgi:hypothetical protein